MLGPESKFHEGEEEVKAVEFSEAAGDVEQENGDDERRLFEDEESHQLAVMSRQAVFVPSELGVGEPNQNEHQKDEDQQQHIIDVEQEHPLLIAKNEALRPELVGVYAHWADEQDQTAHVDQLKDLNQESRRRELVGVLVLAETKEVSVEGEEPSGDEENQEQQVDEVEGLG